MDSDHGGIEAGAAEARVRRRDRRGRGLRGRLVPPTVPMYRTRAEQFDDIVLDAVARLEPRWESELSSVEFAVQEVPDAEELGDDRRRDPARAGYPRGRRIAGTPIVWRPPVRIVIYRRPLLARAENDDDSATWCSRSWSRSSRGALGIDPNSVDPEEISG